RLWFLGRMDRQLKVRGFRIEPGEIEAHLLALTGIRSAAVDVESDALVAYYVAGGGWPPAGEIQDALVLHLPPHMVPQRLMALDALPLGPTGKLDPAALAARSRPRTGGRQPPRNATERALVEIWKAVLHRDEVGTEADFFDLGGHSLLAASVMSRAGAALGRELPVKTLFRSRTIADLAAAFDAAPATPAGPPPWAPPARSLPSATPARPNATPPRTPSAACGSCTSSSPAAPSTTSPSPIGTRGRSTSGCCDRPSTRSSDGTGRAAPRPRWRAAIRSRSSPPSGPSGWRWSTCDRSRRTSACSRDSGWPSPRARPRSPWGGGSWRARVRTPLLTLADADCVLLLTMHHIVSDGWSVRVLLEELATLLSAFGAGEPSPLPELPTQYSAYARAQRDRLKGPVLDGLLAYWRDRLAGAPAVIELPLDRPRPKLQRSLGATLPVTFSAELLRGLRALARDHDATLFMVLLAGFGLTLHR